MTIGELKASWRDLPAATEVSVMDDRPRKSECRDVKSLEIERELTSDEDGTPTRPIDRFIIRLSA